MTNVTKQQKERELEKVKINLNKNNEYKSKQMKLAIHNVGSQIYTNRTVNKKSNFLNI